MTIEYRDRSEGGSISVMTECPVCEEPLREGQGWAEHWPNCDENPANGGETDG